jgi:uncharacterized protein (TIGR03437 family)
VQVAPELPGTFNANGIGQAIATDDADGAIVAPARSIAGVTTHPIQIGNYLIIWSVGLRPVDSDVFDGANTGGDREHARRAYGANRQSLGDFGYSFLSLQYVGEDQVAVQVAAGTPVGDACAGSYVHS